MFPFTRAARFMVAFQRRWTGAALWLTFLGERELLMKLDRRLNLGVRAAATGALALVVSLSACGSVETNTSKSGGTGGPTTDVSSSGSGSTGSGITPPSTVASKIDLLLMIDNSRSMADKQEILGAAVPDLVERLANPPCVDPSGALGVQTSIALPLSLRELWTIAA